MKCLETRQRNGMKWRRYRTPDGRTLTTYELPATVLSGVTTMARLRARLEMFEKGEAMRARRQLVLQRIGEGVKPLAIADELGMSTREVQRVRRMLNA